MLVGRTNGKGREGTDSRLVGESATYERHFSNLTEVIMKFRPSLQELESRLNPSGTVEDPSPIPPTEPPVQTPPPVPPPGPTPTDPVPPVPPQTPPYTPG